MKVTLKGSHTFGNTGFNSGTQELPDHLHANQAFRKAVKAGSIVVHPRDPEAIKAQASKDARALQKSIMAKKTAELAQAERSKLVNNKSPDSVSQFDKAEQAAKDAPAVTPAPSSAQPDAKEVPAAQALPTKPSAAARATGKSS